MQIDKSVFVKELDKPAFVGGFKWGFTSPYLFFVDRRSHFSYRRIDTISNAWRLVGKDLAQATKIEGDRIGKSSKKFGTRTERATAN